MTHFGTLKDGREVEAVTLSAHGLSVTILTLGAILQDVRLDGVDYNLTLGSKDLTDYEGVMEFHGSIVGPVSNRLQHAAALIAGKKHWFDMNQNGRHTLHSGSAGVHRKIWQIDEKTDKTAKLSCKLLDREGGFPANRFMSAEFEILTGATLRLTITTTTDAPSIVNATNHSYWNLDGSGHISGHQMRVDARSYLPTDDADFLVTGEVRSVQNRPYDFRAYAPLEPAKPPLDHTFCVAGQRRELTECFWAKGQSSVKMAVSTTEAGVHVYDGRHAGYQGFAVEAQGWPDAPNRAGFPSIEITPEAPVVQVTQWQFWKD